MERDPRVNITEITVIYFNSHAHVERDVVIVGIFFSLNNFNSHAHVERDMNEFYASGLTNISTHTLTWSVTFSLLAVIFPNVYFNSHAHVERDT